MGFTPAVWVNREPKEDMAVREDTWWVPELQLLRSISQDLPSDQEQAKTAGMPCVKEDLMELICDHARAWASHLVVASQIKL